MAAGHPLETRRRSKFSRDVAALAKLFEDREVGGLVVGLPLNMDGTEGVRVQKTRDWAKELLRHHDLPLVFQDERLSTFEAEQAMIAADVSRKAGGPHRRRRRRRHPGSGTGRDKPIEQIVRRWDHSASPSSPIICSVLLF